MRNLRAHLRHTGSTKLRFGATRFSRKWRDTESWGINVKLGRWTLVFRDRNLDPPHYNPKRFFDLDFGRAQLKFDRLFESMSDDEKNLYQTQHPPVYLKPFLELLRSDPVAAHKRFGPYPNYEGEQNDHA